MTISLNLELRGEKNSLPIRQRTRTKVYSKKLDQDKKTDQENRQNYTVRHQIRTTEKCKTMDQDNRIL